MELLDLPNEILYLVADNLPQLRDIASLTRTCHPVHTLLTEYLYRTAARQVPDFEVFSPALLFCIKNDLGDSLAHSLKWTSRVPVAEHENWPLAMALENNNLGIARQILERWGTPSLECQANGLFFATAICKKNVDMVRLLLEYSCSVSHPDYPGKTPLQLAARSGCEDIIMLLL
jgi:hypothetical protein